MTLDWAVALDCLGPVSGRSDLGAWGGRAAHGDMDTEGTTHHAAAHEGHVGLFLDQGRLMAVHRGGVVEPARHRGRPRSAA